MGAIYLVRHGQASFGTDNYDRLSDLGKRQSVHLGEHFHKAGVRFDRIVIGTMVRHHETMTHCLTAMQTPITPEISDNFNEFDHEEVVARLRPEFESKQALSAFLATQDKPAAAFQRIFDEAMQRWLSGRHDEDYTESWARFRRRCLDGFHTLTANAGPSRSMAVFTSGGPISIIAQSLLGVPDAHVLKLNYAMINASVTRILYQGSRISLSSFNSYAHLEALNDSRLITYR